MLHGGVNRVLVVAAETGWEACLLDLDRAAASDSSKEDVHGKLVVAPRVGGERWFVDADLTAGCCPDPEFRRPSGASRRTSQIPDDQHEQGQASEQRQSPAEAEVLVPAEQHRSAAIQEAGVEQGE